MGIVLVIYGILLIVFLVVAALVVRHTVKYGYLSPKFRTIVSIFGLLSLGVVIFSLYLVLSLVRGTSAPNLSIPTPSRDVEINF